MPYLSLASSKARWSDKVVTADIELSLGEVNIDEDALERLQAFVEDYNKHTRHSTCLSRSNEDGRALSGARLSDLLQQHGFNAADLFSTVDDSIVWNDQKSPVRRGQCGCVDIRELLEALLASCLLK